MYTLIATHKPYSIFTKLSKQIAYKHHNYAQCKQIAYKHIIMHNAD